MEAVAYHTCKYPLNAIGPVKVLLGNTKMSLQQIIIVVHPAISKELLGELCEVFGNHPLPSNDYCERGTKKSIELHCLDFTIFNLTGPESTSILNKVLNLTASNQLKHSVEGRRVFNLCVHDPRFQMQRKKNNPLARNNAGHYPAFVH